MRKPANPKKGEPIRLSFTASGAPKYRVTLDVSKKGQKREQVTRVFGSIKEARDHINDTRADLSRGTYVKPTKVTVQKLLDQHLIRVERGDHGKGAAVRPSTLAGYKAAAKRVTDLLGTREVAGLTEDDARHLVDTLAEKYAVKSVSLSLVLLRSALNHAAKRGQIPRLVADVFGDVAPRGKAPVERLGYSAEDVTALAAELEDNRLAGVFLLILNGFRRGEALGCRWEDFERAVVTVRRSRVWLGKGPVDGEPKTERGKREVLLDPVTLSQLKSMHRAHAAEALAVGRPMSEADHLAVAEDGSALRPETVAAEWRALCKKADVVDLGLHAARHGHVQLLRKEGVPDGVIARRLGHDENVMRVTYGRPPTNEQQLAAEVMGRLFGQSVTRA